MHTDAAALYVSKQREVKIHHTF